GDRRECEESYSSAMGAVDVTTGAEARSLQTVYHDIWAYDIGAQATVLDFPTREGTAQAVSVATKQGHLHDLAAATGEPLTEVEERPVPQGSVEGEWTSEVQPFSVGMPRVAGDEEITERDMWGISPLDQLWCRIQYHRLRYEGMYTPPS